MKIEELTPDEIRLKKGFQIQSQITAILQDKAVINEMGVLTLIPDKQNQRGGTVVQLSSEITELINSKVIELLDANIAELKRQFDEL